MSYSVSGSGHGVNAEKAKAAFEQFVQGLDEATSEQGTKFEGSISGGEYDAESGTTNSFSLSASAVRAAAAETADEPEGDTEA
jgi:hypothetical protein